MITYKEPQFGTNVVLRIWKREKKLDVESERQESGFVLWWGSDENNLILYRW